MPKPSPVQPSNIHNLHNRVILFAGNSQDGIQAIGGFLARLARDEPIRM